MDAEGYHGTLFTLLNPYGILTGILFVLLFIVHGALWLSIKTDGTVNERAKAVAARGWYFLLVVAVIFLIYTAFATNLYRNFIENPVWFIVPGVGVLALLGVKVFSLKNNYPNAFYSSCLTILMITFTGVVGLYPNLIPSSISPEYNLTIFNSSSSPYTLKIMTIVAVIFVPVVIAYQIFVYRTFREKISPEEIVKDKEAY
jgi:cytochrome d ubiquinol oxidase subunit II